MDNTRTTAGCKEEYYHRMCYKINDIQYIVVTHGEGIYCCDIVSHSIINGEKKLNLFPGQGVMILSRTKRHQDVEVVFFFLLPKNTRS